MTNQSLLAVASIIQRCAELRADVLNVRHEVQWPDGTLACLHPVRQHDAHALLLRAVHHNGHWILFDLAHVIPRDVEDIKQAPERDQVGLVLYALRRCFHNKDAFLARLDRQHLARWPGEGRPAGSRPTRTGRSVEQAGA